MQSDRVASEKNQTLKETLGNLAGSETARDKALREKLVCSLCVMAVYCNEMNYISSYFLQRVDVLLAKMVTEKEKTLVEKERSAQNIERLQTAQDVLKGSSVVHKYLWTSDKII